MHLTFSCTLHSPTKYPINTLFSIVLVLSTDQAFSFLAAASFSFNHCSWSIPKPSFPYAFHAITFSNVEWYLSSTPHVCNFEFRFFGSSVTSLYRIAALRVAPVRKVMAHPMITMRGYTDGSESQCFLMNNRFSAAASRFQTVLAGEEVYCLAALKMMEEEGRKKRAFMITSTVMEEWKRRIG